MIDDQIHEKNIRTFGIRNEIGFYVFFLNTDESRNMFFFFVFRRLLVHRMKKSFFKTFKSHRGNFNVWRLKKRIRPYETRAVTA